MPGLQQLKKFAETMKSLGNEEEIRSEKGEPIVSIPLPQNISEADDSDDFKFGLPTQKELSEDTTENQEPAISYDDLPTLDDLQQTDIQDAVHELDMDLANLLNPEEVSEEALKQFTDYSETLMNQNQNETTIPDAVDELTELLSEISEDSEIDTNFDLAKSETSFDDTSDDFSLPEIDTNFDLAKSETSFDDTSDDFSLPEIDTNFDLPQSETSETLSEVADLEEASQSQTESSFSDLEDFSLDDLSGIDLESEPREALDSLSETSDSNFSLSDFDLPDFNSPEKNSATSNFGSLEDIDSIETTDTMLDSLADNSDEMDFAIPGFSDFDIPTEQPANSYFESPDNSFTPRENLTDEEYKQFKKNLALYPLNLRIAIEELIVNKEIRDEAIFDLIEKIIKKLSARQLASHLSKYFDITIDVPRDFEKRTAEQYQEYKSSIGYQLKNRIIPVALVTLLVVLVFMGMYRFVEHFIYKPIIAENLYKEGYALIENTMYQQADIKFNEAEFYKPKLKWYFKYAENYREHRQYDRARQKYIRVLRNFEQNKQAGLDYARMEFEELENYPAAEEILRREVLDYHINDVDARLMLGDVFLAWATEVDKSKFKDAHEEYLALIEQIGTNDVLLTRLLRYNIRTDNLKEVLELKNYFYPREKSLEAKDLTELSGYLLDKSYGHLAPADEYLRNYIEDVSDLLNRAYLADPQNPEAQYNLGRYFYTIGNSVSAEQWLATAIKSFSKLEKISKKLFYKHIDTHRLLGEVYSSQEEYLKAEEILSQAISEFEREEKYSGLPGNQIIGKTYSALADIDYFISGNLDAALLNYHSAIKYGNETPSIRYHEGYIHYVKKDFDKALNSFIHVYEDNNSDKNGILALANTLALKNNNYAAQGYYQQLLQILDTEKSRHAIMFPQVNPEHGSIVENFMKASNNLGVILWRLAEQTGNSALISQSLENFTVSLRAWDALTRNPDTLQRLEGSNLAAQNLKYASANIPQFELGLYTNIPNILSHEKPLRQSSVNQED